MTIIDIPKTSASIKFFPARELLAQPAPVPWLVQHLLIDGSLITLLGPSGSLKSFIALDILASAATGSPYHGKRTNHGATYYICTEGNVARRLKAWSIVRDASLSEAPLFISTSAIGLTDPLNAAAVAAEVQRLSTDTGTKPRLVVIDTLARCFGAGDENSASDVGQFVANVDKHIRQFFGCAVLIVHHTGLADSGRARGSSALRAAVDTELVVERTDRMVTIRCTKQKDAPEFEPLGFEARVVELPWFDDDGEPETSLVLHPVEITQTAAKAVGLGDNQRRALEVLRTMYAENHQRLIDGGHDPAQALVRFSDWRERLDLDRRRFSEVREKLESRALIVIDMPHVRLT